MTEEKAAYILIVSRDIETAHRIQESLEGDGHKVEAIPDSEIALIRVKNELPALLILDILDEGFFTSYARSFLRDVYRLPNAGDMPSIVLHTVQKQKDEGIMIIDDFGGRGNADIYWPKPIKKADLPPLVKTIRCILNDN